jgi:hypothetical protein
LRPKQGNFRTVRKLCALDGDVQTTERAYNSVSIEHGGANQVNNVVWLVVGSTVFEVEVEVEFSVRLRKKMHCLLRLYAITDSQKESF